MLKKRKAFLKRSIVFPSLIPHKRFKKTQPIANYISQTFEEKHGQKRLLNAYLYPSYTLHKCFEKDTT
jgi:hypothetical protein